MSYLDGASGVMALIKDHMAGLMFMGFVGHYPDRKEYFLTDPGLEYCQANRGELERKHAELMAGSEGVIGQFKTL